MKSSTGFAAPAALQERFVAVVRGLEGRTVATEALFEVLRLETLDWGLDHGIEVELVETAAAAPAAETP